MAVTTTALVVLSPSAALGSQIDNDHDRVMSFWLDCGISCGNYYDDVLPGTSVGRSNLGGHIEAGVFTADLTWICDKNGVHIGSAGEVGVSFTKANSEEGNARPYFNYFSRGGNDWESPPAGRQSGKLTVVDSARCWHGTP